ncbi:MAG: Uma2 family endonuclease [Isosphaeraceae bacterium]
MPTASRPKRADRPAGSPLQGVATLGDLLKRLGNIPARRVRLHPTPGTATKKDAIRVLDRENRTCELVDGTLVEKAMGYEESLIAVLLGTYLNNFVLPRKLGVVTGADGTVQLHPGLLRAPDVAFTSWATLPGGKVPTAAIPQLAPDLAVEVLSKGNTRAEMARKLRDYLQAGVRLVWMIDPRTRVVRVHTAPDRFSELKPGQTLDGGDVLPGFRVAVAELFPDREG